VRARPRLFNVLTAYISIFIKLLCFLAQASGALSTLFHFEMMNVDVVPGSPFGKWEYCMPNLQQIKAIMSRWQTELDAVQGWNSVFIENHDTPRSVSRFGNDSTPELREASAKMLATWMLLLKGTPFIYQGQEIGTPNAYFDDLNDYRDIETFNAFKEMTTRRPPEVVMDSIKRISRDNARTPMQWSSEEVGGFSELTSWIKPNPSFKTVNVAQARADTTSVWHYYKRLLEFRKKHMAIIYGEYQILVASHPEIYAYTRTLDNEMILVICNFFDKCPEFNLPQELVAGLAGGKVTKEFCNYDTTREEQVDLQKIQLRPYEARVYSVTRH
jgi:oligo-1,6-glucosidase